MTTPDKNALLPDQIRSDNYHYLVDPSPSKQLSASDVVEVKDKFNLIYWISLILGCGILLSYNFLISAPDYFSTIYPDYNVNFLIVPAYTIPDIIFLFICLFYGHLFSFTTRIVISFILMGIFMFFPFFTFFLFPSSQQIGFYIILSVSAVAGITTAVLQTAIMGFCNFLPVSYIQVNIGGQAMAGIIAGVFRIIINLIEQYTPMSAQTNGLIYFGIGGVFDLFCAISFLYAIRSAFVKFHLKDYFWTRKYRGTNIDNDNNQNNENANDHLLHRADTETILRKIVDDNVPTPKAADFEKKNIKKQTVVVPVKRNRNKHKNGKKMATSLERQSATYMRFRHHTHSMDKTQNGDEYGGYEREEVEITKSHNSTVSTAHSINAYGNGHKLLIVDPVLDEEELSDEKDFSEEVDIYTEEESVEQKVTVWSVFKKVKLLALALFLVFFVTFLPFPAMIVSLESQYDLILPFPVILVVE